MVWPTLGSRTAKEQNRYVHTVRLRFISQFSHIKVIMMMIINHRQWSTDALFRNALMHCISAIRHIM